MILLLALAGAGLWESCLTAAVAFTTVKTALETVEIAQRIRDAERRRSP